MRTLWLTFVALLGFAACIGNSNSNPLPPAPTPECVALDGCHVAGEYDTSTGTCSNPLAPDGTACTIGTNTCFVGSTCSQGNCVGGASASDGTACDDHNACTTGDSCLSGACQGGSAVTCTQDIAVCYAETACDPNRGCPAHNGPCNPNLLPPMPLGGCPFSDYYGNVGIGNQTFAVVMDSGSTTLAVAGTACKTCQNEGITPRYTPGTNAADQHLTTSSQYGDGTTWVGEVYRDQVSLAAWASDVNMRFASITTDQGFFRDGTCQNITSSTANYNQGIMGLEGSLDETPHTDSWLVNMGLQGNVTQAFSVELCDNGGRMWMGGYDPNSIGAPVNFSNTLKTDNHYSLNLKDVAFAGQSLGLGSAAYSPAVIDTGTTLMLVTQDVLDTIMQVLRADTAFTNAFDVNDIFELGYCAPTVNGASTATLDATLPRFTMTFPNRLGGTFAVDAAATSSYLYPMDDGQGGTCFLFMIDTLPSGFSGSIVGNTMMRSSVIVFDNTGAAVGFTPQVDDYCPAHNFHLRAEDRPMRRPTRPQRIKHRGRGPHRPIVAP